LKANVLSVQAWITVAFLLFIVLTSNPFSGFAGAGWKAMTSTRSCRTSAWRSIRRCSISAMSASRFPFLCHRGADRRPHRRGLGALGASLDAAAWVFLTAGISMGSYWAYYELGWGGWWFWDPVENASFMPWLAGTALLHSALVMEKREALKVWTVLLAILTFSLSLLGTFLVRSGVLTSVHAFATDPTRGVFILGILVVFIGGALALFGLRPGRSRPAACSRRSRARARWSQQPVPDHRDRHGAGRHALSAAARSADRRSQDLRRPALLQPHLRIPLMIRPARRLLLAVPFGPLPRLEARRSLPRSAFGSALGHMGLGVGLSSESGGSPG
jgi:cytochrome c biogenesis factor